MADKKIATLLKTVFDNDDATIPPSEAVRLLATALHALCAKLDLDAGVTDTNYAAVVDAISL